MAIENYMNNVMEENCMDTFNVVYVSRDRKFGKYGFMHYSVQDEKILRTFADLVSLLAEECWSKNQVEGLDSNFAFEKYLKQANGGFFSEEEAFNFFGFELVGIKEGQCVYKNKLGKRPEEYGVDGIDDDGYNIYGFNRIGWDREGYSRKGYDRNGYDREGYDVNGYNREGYDKDGYDKDGYDKDGVDKDGYTRNGEYYYEVYDEYDDHEVEEDDWYDNYEDEEDDWYDANEEVSSDSEELYNEGFGEEEWCN